MCSFQFCLISCTLRTDGENYTAPDVAVSGGGMPHGIHLKSRNQLTLRNNYLTTFMVFIVCVNKA